MEEANLPTFVVNSDILLCILNARDREEHDVAIINTPDASIQTVVKEEKDFAITRIQGIWIKMLCKIAPEAHEPFVTEDMQR